MKFMIKDTDYAVKALVFMASQGRGKVKKIITVEEIVKEEALPERFLRKILQRLAKRKVLVSHKGRKGGFSFLMAPRDIKLTDIMEIFQGKVDIANCLLKGKICPDTKKCALKQKLKNINISVERELKKITIGSLLEEERNDETKDS